MTAIGVMWRNVSEFHELRSKHWNLASLFLQPCVCAGNQMLNDRENIRRLNLVWMKLWLNWGCTNVLPQYARASGNEPTIYSRFSFNDKKLPVSQYSAHQNTNIWHFCGWFEKASYRRNPWIWCYRKQDQTKVAQEKWHQCFFQCLAC